MSVVVRCGLKPAQGLRFRVAGFPAGCCTVPRAQRTGEWLNRVLLGAKGRLGFCLTDLSLTRC